jgi:hypothetical protein
MGAVFRGKALRVDSVRVGDASDPGRVVVALSGQGRRVVYCVLKVDEAREVAERLDLAIEGARIERELSDVTERRGLVAWLRALPMPLGLGPVGVERLSSGGER